MKLSPSTENPNSFGNWPTRMVSASPFIYPIMVGFDRRSATNPKRARPASVVMAPTSNASIERRGQGDGPSWISPCAPTSGKMVAAIIGPREESGPNTSTFDGPNRA